MRYGRAAQVSRRSRTDEHRRYTIISARHPAPPRNGTLPGCLLGSHSDHSRSGPLSLVRCLCLTSTKPTTNRRRRPQTPLTRVRLRLKHGRGKTSRGGFQGERHSYAKPMGRLFCVSSLAKKDQCAARNSRTPISSTSMARSRNRRPAPAKRRFSPRECVRHGDRMGRWHSLRRAGRGRGDAATGHGSSQDSMALLPKNGELPFSRLRTRRRHPSSR